jgi:hypothetical protein
VLEPGPLNENRVEFTHHNVRYTQVVNSAPNNTPVADKDESHAAPTTLGWRLSLWIAIATILLIQVVGLNVFLRHHGVFYNAFYRFPVTVLHIGGNIIAALGLRFILYRGFTKSTTSRSLAPGPNYAALGLEMFVISLVLALTWYAYSWPKVMVPILNPRLWDGLLARIDVALCLGVNPNELFLTIFEGAPRVLNQMIDRYYGLFVLSQGGLTAWFVTDPRANKRIAFSSALILLWVLGTWSYVVMPALGPVYVFEDYFQRVAAIFPANAAVQSALLTNYNAVHRITVGENAPIMMHLGIAAMPSLHVAANVFFYLWSCFAGSRLRLPLLAMATLTLITSMVLCWHYLIDGLAGIAFAGAAFGAGIVINRLLDARGASQLQAAAESLP